MSMEGAMIDTFLPSVLNPVIGRVPGGLADEGEFVYSRAMDHSPTHIFISVAASLRLLLP